MKKRRLYNRIGCAILSFVMILTLGISPAATKVAKADWNTEITSDVSIVVKPDTQESLTFEEDQEYDIASYFTVNYGEDEAPYLCDYSDPANWFSNLDGYTPYSELFSVSYSKITDGTESSLSEAPTRPGTYRASVTFEKGDDDGYYVYANGAYEGWFSPSEIKSATIDYTITESSEPDDETYEGLKLMYGNEELADEDAFILLMFGDGFAAEDQKTFYKESKKIADYIMATSPYDEFADTIKIYAYGTVSNESGARADKATTQAEADADTRDTYFGTSFWTGGMQRLLSVNSDGLAKVEALKKDVLPSADFSVIVVNSDTYGGSGGEVCVASLNSSSLEMMLHELGHTVANLADEYWAGASYASELANMTKESDPTKVRWARFVGKNGVGVYKHEQSETSTDWYRPSDNCKMQYLRQSAPFCEVCKEELRKTFCNHSDVTKIFFQTYADEFYQGAEGKDMSEYFIIRRGGNEITGDKLGDKLTLVYKDDKGNVVDGIPSVAGDYTIEATFAGDDTYKECSMTAEYTIELPDLITIDAASSKVYDGNPMDISINVDYEEDKYTTEVHYTGTMPYTNYEDIPYDSDEAPIKPGKYTVEVKAYDKESGLLISKKSKSYQITFKITTLTNNNTGEYPGAQDWYNNKQIVIVGEGFTADEQDKFEKAAKDYVDYILNTEPFKETQLYFNFAVAEVVSDESGIGTEPKDTYFGLRYDENGKIIPENIQAIANIGYNNVSPYYKANIIIVNDENVKEGAVTKEGYRGYVYGGLDDKEYVARELLNYLTGQDEGYVADTKEKAEAQRADLLSALFYTWYGEDYAIVVSRVYDEQFVENGSPVEMEKYFQTYVLGKEVPREQLNYTFTYYDSEGNELDGAPTRAGTYKVLGELIPSSDAVYASDNDGKVFWKVRDDETYDENGEVFDANGNSIGWLFTDPVTEVTLEDGTTHYIPRARGLATFKISSAQEVKIDEAQDYLSKAQEALANEDAKTAQEYLAKAEEAMKAAEAAEEESIEDRQELDKALKEAQKQVAEALEQSEKDKAAAEEALKKAEEALKEAEAAKKEAEIAKQNAANQVATAKFQAKKASIKSVKTPSKKALKVTWKAVSGAEGYQIQYSKKSNFKSAKTVTVKGASKKTTTIKKLTSKKKYYVRVRAYKTIGGKKVYTSWSTKKSIKVK
ncbi:MAG: M64 family metallopeptidase [Lachnospiraceae bacterium]